MLTVPDNKFLISQAIDIVNMTSWNTSFTNQMFKSKTNLPSNIQLQPGARVIILLSNIKYVMVL